MFNKLMVAFASLFALNVFAAEVPITGTVQSKCVITTDTAGVFGLPANGELSTARADGGILPVVRYDAILADAYYAKITAPTNFTSSPSLTDTVTWASSTSVKKVSETAMSAYETNKIVTGDTTQFDLTEAGSVWFQTDVSATYGGGKPFPGGNYKAVVVAECIAK